MRLVAKRHSREVVLFICGLGIVIASVALGNGRLFAIGQGKRKSISRGVIVRDPSNDPVRIGEIKVGANARRFEEQFDEADDWLRQLSLVIENDYQKPIVYLLVSLDFPETQASGNEMRFYIYLGNEPGLPVKRENLYIAPGEKLVVNMAERYESLSQFLRSRHSVSEINKVEIQVALAVFEDKTAWGGGEFFVQDPNKPGRYTNVGRKPPTATF
jgi:hypothetical protein